MSKFIFFFNDSEDNISHLGIYRQQVHEKNLICLTNTYIIIFLLPVYIFFQLFHWIIVFVVLVVN